MNAGAAVLRARARALAQVPAAPPAPGSWLEVLEFRLAQERYAVETRRVREVWPLKDLTALPGTPAFVLGIVNLRGRVLPVLDLRRFFDLPQTGITDLHRIIVAQGDDFEVGLLADTIGLIVQLPTANLQSALPTLTGIRCDYLKGVTADSLAVLDLDRILADPKIVVDDAKAI